MPEEVKKGIYRHYKGKDYKVLCVATHSETEERLVVYQAFYGDFDHWVRPVSMFTEHVQIDGELVPRFKYIGQ